MLTSQPRHSPRSRAQFWLIDRVRGTSVLSVLRDLERSQFEPPPALAARQADARTRYFQEVQRHCSLFGSARRFEDLPIIDKRFANTHREQLTNHDFRGKRFRKKTGGSTGEPFVYFTGALSQSYLWAGILLSWRTAGYELGEPVTILAGSAVFGSGLSHRSFYRLMNATLLSAFDISEERLSHYARTVAATRARILYGYSGAIHRLAMHLLENSIPPPVEMKGVICTAETLTASMRQSIEQAFRAPCLGQYGCNDAGVSAFECRPGSGYHLITTRCYPELLQDGRLVATDLTNLAFFLPRYDTGDRVVFSPTECLCGRGFPLISEVLGRANDVVVDRRGKAVHSEFFTHLFREDPRISAFQVLFDSNDLLVNVLPRKRNQDWSAYSAHLRSVLDFREVSIMETSDFMTGPSGKRRFVARVPSLGQDRDSRD